MKVIQVLNSNAELSTCQSTIQFAVQNGFIDNENIIPNDYVIGEIHWKSRWTPDQIKAMLLEQFTAFWQRNNGIEREQLAWRERATESTHAVIISGCAEWARLPSWRNSRIAWVSKR